MLKRRKLSRDEFNERLKNLVESKNEVMEKLGAMCYSQDAPENVPFKCEKCAMSQ